MAIDANNSYAKQVQLLVRVLPIVDTEKCFALKGGTAINLFYRPLPRLSVDIDLLYIPMDDRETALKNIREALTRISEKICKSSAKSGLIYTETKRVFLKIINFEIV